MGSCGWPTGCSYPTFKPSWRSSGDSRTDLLRGVGDLLPRGDRRLLRRLPTPPNLVVAAALSASLGAAGMAASLNTAAFAAFAIVSSAGAGLASPGLVSIVRRNVSVETIDRSQAIVNAGTGPGLVAAGILALMLLPNWRLAWFIVAAFTLVIAAAVLLLDRGQPSKFLQTSAARPGIPPRSWFGAHRYVILAAFFLGVGSAAVWNYGRTHLVDAGVTDQASVAAWIALGLSAEQQLSVPHADERAAPAHSMDHHDIYGRRATATLGLAPNATIAVLVGLRGFGWGYTAGSGALIAWTTHIDAARAPAGTSLLFVILVLGQALGAAAIGMLVSSAGFVVAFLAASAIALVATVAPWRTKQADDDAVVIPSHGGI